MPWAMSSSFFCIPFSLIDQKLFFIYEKTCYIMELKTNPSQKSFPSFFRVKKNVLLAMDLNSLRRENRH